MRRWAIWIPLLAATLLVLLARPFVGQPEIDACIIAGRVTNEDGTPAAGVPVTVRTATRAFTFTTDAQGFYTGDVVPGPVTVQTGRTIVQATLAVGGLTRVDLVLTNIGWTLRVTDTAGATTMPASALLYYRTADGRDGQVGADYAMRPALVFMGVPANARAVAIAVRTGGVTRAQRWVVQQWTFTDDATRRELTMTVERPGSVTLLIADEAGAPVSGGVYVMLTAGDVDLTTPTRLLQPGPPPTRAATLMNNVQMVAGADGRLNLDLLAPGAYQVTLRSSWTTVAPMTGKSVTFTVTDNTPLTVPYTLAPHTRVVTQTVFGFDGAPLANTVVSATHVRLGKEAAVRQARTDARGVVVWPDITARTLVWSDRSPVVALPDAGDTITAPLPAAAPGQRLPVTFVLARNAPRLPRGTRLHWRYYGQSSGMAKGEATFLGGDSDSTSVANFVVQAARGELFTLVGATTDTPPAIVSVLHGCVPVPDATVYQITYPLTPAPSLASTFRFTAADAEVPAVSRVLVASVDPAPAAASPATLRRMWREVGLLQPVDLQDGAVRAYLPAPGRYAVAADLYEPTGDLPDGCVVQVTAEAPDRQVALPAPLFRVPAGTEVSWLSRVQAGEPQSLIAGAMAPEVPIFGPREALLAAWHRPTARELVIWRPDGPEQRLALRPATVEAIPPTDLSLRQFGLLPLLPVPRGDVGLFKPGPRLPSERIGMLFDGVSGSALRADLWSGRYLVTSVPSRGTGADPRGVADLAQGGPAVIPLASSVAPARTIKLTFPAAKYATLGATAAPTLTCTFDVPGRVSLAADAIGARRTVYGYVRPPVAGQDTPTISVQVPAAARAITIRWPGVGTIADAPLPAEGAGDAVTQPAWQPGCIVAGRVLGADGRPLASAVIVVDQPGLGTDGRMVLSADAQGQFVAPGLAPGLLSVAAGPPISAYAPSAALTRRAQGAWTLEAPAAGLADVTLRVTADPVTIAFGAVAASFDMWWLPDGGRPHLVPVLGSALASDLPQRPGWLWIVARNGTTHWCGRLTLTPGANVVSVDSPCPSLGLVLPFSMAYSPGAVTLTGHDARAGIRVVLNPVWQMSPQLGLTVAQVDHIPPGRYTVTVATPRGDLQAIAEVTDAGGFVGLRR